jgi:hypothetical protein
VLQFLQPNQTELDLKFRFQGSALQYESFQVVLENHVLDAGHRLLEEIGVGRVSQVHVDVLHYPVSTWLASLAGIEAHLSGVSVETLEVLLEVLRRMLVVLRVTLVVGKVLLDRRNQDLLLEQIDLVEEQDYGSSDEPLRVADALEQHQSLLHLVLQNRSARVTRVYVNSRHWKLPTASLSSTRHWS